MRPPPLLPTQWSTWLEPVRHLCFDKDGVLIDVHRYWRHTVQLRAERLRARFHLPEPSVDGVMEAMGVNLQTGMLHSGGPVGYAPRPVVVDAAKRYLASAGVAATREELQQLFAAVDQQQQQAGDYDLQILPDVPEFLDALSVKGIVLTIVSSDRKEHIQYMLQRVGLAKHFSQIIGGACVTHPKPHPEGFLLACARVGIPPTASAYLSDLVDDMRMGVAGGAQKVIGVATGLSTRDALRHVTPYVCGRLLES